MTLGKHFEKKTFQNFHFIFNIRARVHTHTNFSFLKTISVIIKFTRDPYFSIFNVRLGKI